MARRPTPNDELKLEHYFARYEFNAPYFLCGSDCETLSVFELLAMEPQATDDLSDLRLGYTETLGNPRLRRETASLYTGINPNQVLVHTGAEEAVFNFMNATPRAGDHIVVHWPCYQSLYEVAQSIGCEVTKWETHDEERWELDLDFLKRNLRPRTKVVVINCPHNPTGYPMAKEKLLEIDGLSKERGFIIFSDEVYRFLEGDRSRDSRPSGRASFLSAQRRGRENELRLAGIARRDGPAAYALTSELLKQAS